LPAGLVYDAHAPKHEVMPVLQASRWESLVWPRWLPVRARLPFIAQITGSVALTALLVAPWWSSIPDSSADEPPTVAAAPQPAAAPPKPAPAPAPAPPPPAAVAAAASPSPARPAHLNLDVRHTFGSVDLSVTVNGKPALNTRLDGSGKRFKVFGKRAERGFTKTLDVPPGVHVVRVRVQSADDKFDQTRTERFDLGSASVAALRIAADKSGLSIAAVHPPAPPRATPAPATAAATPVATPVAAPVTALIPASAPAVPDAPRPPVDNDMIDLVLRLRSMLIAIAGMVASAATGALVQEFVKRKRGLIPANGVPLDVVDGQPRRRRQAGFHTQGPA
jgi:hypothetical protein